MADGIFALLDDEQGFCEFIREKFSRAPGEITGIMRCEHVLDQARIRFAFNEYKQSLSKFSVFLHSENPDHYKRAGALLSALIQSDVITELKLESSADDLEGGFSRVTKADADYVFPFVRFYETYYNEAAAFQVAYRCCAAYEAEPREFDVDYFYNVCRYLRADKANFSQDAAFMLFKSLMV